MLTALFVAGEGLCLLFLAQSHNVSRERLTADTGITAHRGGARNGPENTISALGQAISTGADMAEIDVQENGLQGINPFA